MIESWEKHMGSISDVDKMIEETKSMDEYLREDEEKYSGLVTEELKNLPDEELIMALITRTADALFDQIDPEPTNDRDYEAALKSAFDRLNKHQKLFYAVMELETQVNNGGLIQFFQNYSRIVAPIVSGYMGIIGATEHKKLYDDFLAKSAVDPAHLPDFDREYEDDEEGFDEKYPFDEYEDVFYKIEPLETYLLAYAKAHLDSF